MILHNRRPLILPWLALMIAFLDLGIRQAFAQDNLDPWHLPPHRGALNLAVG